MLLKEERALIGKRERLQAILDIERYVTDKT
jgi:hypothetical protein